MKKTLIVGDVQGDWERLEEALANYPQEDFNTVFLGDFFQGGKEGEAGGAKCARIARARKNSQVVLGNHEVYLLSVIEILRGIPLPAGFGEQKSLGKGLIEALKIGRVDAYISYWESRRGDWADIYEVVRDPDLEAWLRGLPLMLVLPDGTLVQHNDSVAYSTIGSGVNSVNEWGGVLLQKPAGVFTLLPVISSRGGFAELETLESYLKWARCNRVIHGHSPHDSPHPEVRHGGRAIDFDAKFSRFWAKTELDTLYGKVGGTVALLPPLNPAL